MSNNNPKRVLIVHYSQTGQLSSVVRSIGHAMESGGSSVRHECLRPLTPYPFPWPLLSFFDVFPESVFLDPPALQPLSVNPDEHFDLIILAYQVWFLSPALPMTAFIKSAAGRKLLANRPVITVIACRNMWLMAQEKMKDLLGEVGARLLDNVALVDKTPSLLTFLTTPRWLLTGNKGKPDGLLPEAGISPGDINDAARFGRAIAAALREGREQQHAPLLNGLEAVKVDTRLIASEKIGARSFFIWGKLLRALGRPGTPARRLALVMYIAFLIGMIVTVVPITMTLKFLLRPWLQPSLEKQRHYFEAPSGSASNRMTEFSHD